MMNTSTGDERIATHHVSVYYQGNKEALSDVSLTFHAGEISALIGPSGCGKSTFLRCLDLMNREITGCRVDGLIMYHDQDINQHADLFTTRQRIGMVFQQPNPFGMSIYGNIALALRRHGVPKAKIKGIVEESLRSAALWDEVKDKLHSHARALSGGQQQRLCIARTLALDPDVILMDEPCSALDPIATHAIEDTMQSLAARGISVIVVTHNMQQALRVADTTAFFYLGEMIESGKTEQIFSNPHDARLRDYVEGRFG